MVRTAVLTDCSTSASVRWKPKGTTTSKIKFVWVGPDTIRKSWMLTAGSMPRTSSATFPRVSPVTPSSVTMGSMDAIREEIVTDTTVYIGSAGNLLEETPSNCNVLQIRNPILTSVDLMKIRYMSSCVYGLKLLPLGSTYLMYS